LVERRDDEDRRDGDQQQGDRRSRQDPARAARVERGEVERARRAELSQQQRGDEEARQDVEDVDTHEATGNVQQVEMEQDDERHRYAAKPLEIGAEPHAAHAAPTRGGTGGGCVWGV